MTAAKPSWRPLLPEDSGFVSEIADAIHTDLPERREVFEEKIRLYPSGCWKRLSPSGKIVGYGIAHTWTLHIIPPLDEFLSELPQSPDCIYVHDVALRPEARGRNAGLDYMNILKKTAGQRGILNLACVSVYGTDALWSRMGFRCVNDKSINEKIAGYGSSAKYMIADI
jgi:GNAT superfamily N-acetyltransferase